MRACVVEGCENGGRIVREMCAMHVTRFRRHGDPLVGGRPTVDERFDANWFTEPNTGCHLWTAALTGSGRYGAFSVSRRSINAHRYAWVRVNGPVPDRMEIHHLCGTRSCVNPEHLVSLTKKEHGAAHAALRTTCPRGHEYDRRNKDGARYCRWCRTDVARTTRRKKSLMDWVLAGMKEAS